MWFINDITIKTEESNEEVIVKICKDNNIEVGNAWHMSKYLGRIVSDKDYLILMELITR